MPTLREVMRSTSGGGRLNAILATLALSEKKCFFSLERLQHTSDLDCHLLMKLSWPISCELRLTLEVKGDQRGRVKQSMTLKTIISEKMRHNALSAIAAATRCGGSGVSCRLQPGRAVAVDSCSLQLGTENKNSTYYSFRDQ